MNRSKSYTGKSHYIDIRYFFIRYRVENEELSIVYCPTYLVSADYFINPLQVSLLHKFRYIIMGRVSPFALLEDKFSYISKDHVEIQIPSKDIPSGTGEPLKETKKIIEDENEKQVRTSTVGPLTKKDIPKDRKVKLYVFMLV